ncbi:MAG: ABC transporter permease, partial [Pseudodonghicola sp.]
MTEVILALILWAFGWWVNVRLAGGPLARTRAVKLAVPVIFGITVLLVWELLVRGLNVPMVILPAPSLIVMRFATSLPTLWIDFRQTILKGALSGYVIGCGAALLMAVLVDR